MRPRQLRYFLGMVIILIACSKKDELLSEQKEESRSPLIGSWQLTSIEVDPKVEHDNSLTSNWLLTIDSCHHDDIEKFNEDFTYSWLGGEIKCNPEDYYILKAGIWELNEDENKVIIQFENSSLIRNYDLINGTKMILTYTKQMNYRTHFFKAHYDKVIE